MRFRLTGKTFYILSMGLLIGACNDVDLQIPAPQDQPIKVGIHTGDVSTRTQIQDNGLSTVWTEGDRLSLWAIGSSGEYALSNQVFTAYGTDAGRGFFTSELPSQMPEDTYIYYCTYPEPSYIEGNTAVFNVPSVQDGKVTSGADVLVATPVTHGPLAPLPEIEDHSAMKLKMNHMMHQFRFFVPQDDEQLQGAEITRMVLTFPEPVVGDVQLDISNPEKNAVLAAGYREITLNLSDPLPNEQQNFACVAFVPTKFSDGQSVHVQAFTVDKIVQIAPIDLCAKECLPGHSTPVRLAIDGLMEFPWQLTFKIDANNLGEDINSVILEAPQGCTWPETNTNIYTYTPGTKIKAGDEFVLRFSSEQQYRAFSGRNINVKYDSDHALMSQNVTVSDISAVDKSSISLTVPYLFFEDFSTLVEYDGDYKDGPYTSVDGASKAAKDLSAYGLGSGWTGARTGCNNAGTAILVGGRVDCVILGATRAYGRLDSPKLSGLKPDASANVSVSFDYSGSRDGSSTYYPVAVCGSTGFDGLLNGYATQFNNNESWTDIEGKQSVPGIPTNGSATSLSKSMTYTITDCTSATRLSWHVAGMGYKNWKVDNGNQWMYIDNIKVQIIK